MIIFIAGATGAVGGRLVPMLLEQGHEVVATTTSPSKAGALRAQGALPVVVDVLDRDAVLGAVAGAEPDVIVHQATALGAAVPDMRHFDRMFAQTNRLRTEGTRNLLDAAAASGVRRVIAQSFTGWPFAREGGAVKGEDAPLDPAPPAPMRQSLAAIRALEDSVTGAPAGIEGVVLRYGGFYGPGTGLARDGGEVTELIRRRKFPVVGAGGGLWSFTHIDDAAGAVLAALEPGGPTGIFQIVDDDPAPSAEWLPALSAAVGAKPPRHVPVWLGRLAAGEAPVMMMTESRGASNAKAKRTLGWTPQWPTWREGFVHGL
ncbi:NAD-dependent epimerase/dehydratase family protein [Conexibacter woesei]|uniref:NAD-dependent epimerase/dehydratase family protein n=1 Tax=Conexibacter woesei TaxID=191495 RepID=UPI000420D163|nr:NAD(P)-dependent oxidoreductase [Conexibacter woesei]